MEILDEKISKSSDQSRRWCFTINNPLGTDIEEVDISKTDLEIKEDYYNLSYIQDNLDYFTFKYVKYEYEDEEDVLNSKEFIVKRPFFKSIEAFREYLTNLEHYKYSIFQYERASTGTLHFQGFVTFKIGKRFSTMKLYFPFGHFEKCKGSNSENREYCSKSETKISGPYEDGVFAEERSRTDITEFINLIQSGTSKKELAKLSSSLYLKERNKIDSIYADTFEDYSRKCRDVDVTYIYGKSGVGKSTYVRRKLGFENTFYVHHYDNSIFTNYNYQDNIVLDEFAGQLNIQKINLLMNVEPYQMRGLNCVKYAAFHHIYIISNYKPNELYSDYIGSDKGIELRHTFNRRLNKIIEIKPNGDEKIIRETEWEECTNEIDVKQGLTKQVKRIYEYDELGKRKIVYDRYKNYQTVMPILSETTEEIYDEYGNLKF